MTSPTRITTPFGFDSTAADVVKGADMSGRRVLISGATSGSGRETARALASVGAEVTMAVRNVDAGAEIAKGITAETGNEAVFVAPLDLLDRTSVLNLVNSWDGPLHVLINNAGVMGIPERRVTPEGWEHTFVTNYLGQFAVALGLHDALAAAGNARIVVVSSNGHALRKAPLNFDDLPFDRQEYDWATAYGESKVMAVLYAVEATRRWAKDGITANALHPGCFKSEIQRYTPDVLDLDIPWRSIEQGAATPVFLATSPLLEGIGGRYFEDVNEALRL